MRKTIRFVLFKKIVRIFFNLEVHTYDVIPSPVYRLGVVRDKKKRRSYTRRMNKPSAYNYCGKCGASLSKYALEHYGGFCKKHIADSYRNAGKAIFKLPINNPGG